MSIKERVKHILVELKGHAPFTLFGAVLGIVFMLLFRNISGEGRHTLFAIFHPAHVLLSAIVTASMFRLHSEKKRFVLVLVVGFFGSVGIATLSDIIIPHIGAELMGLDVPTHGDVYHAEEGSEEEGHTTMGHEHEEHGLHLGFIEEWYIVNPAALLGIFIAYFLPRTKFPHAGHILISTWASSSYILMNMQSDMTVVVLGGILVTLFVATWLPCCVSDIIFPLLFVKSDITLVGCCSDHAHHSHAHLGEQGGDGE
ncbi:MAG: hypothetical protein OEW48_03945 [Phycisphaerae bacterium]|nr:hypothetical protein [Phycisphaerae bacterium]